MTRAILPLPALLCLELWLSPAQASPPGNDGFENAKILITSDTGTNVEATMQGGEPGYGQQRGCSVWWDWTPTVSGMYAIDTFGSDFDTVLGVYTGVAVDALAQVDFNDDYEFDPLDVVSQSRVTFPAVASTTYHVQVSGFAGDTGTVHLCVSNMAPPANDNFASASTLVDHATGTNRFATEQASEPSPSGGTKSVWWSWRAPATTEYTIDTQGIDFSNALGVYTGSNVASLTVVGESASPIETFATQVVFQAFEGTIYRIGVWGLGQNEGTVQLNVSAAPPANDNLANAMDLGSESLPPVSSLELGGATLETAEPDSAGAATRSAWWTWTAPPVSGLLTIDTIGSDIDTILDVFQDATGWNNLVWSNDNYAQGSTASQVSFLVSPGQTYHLRVTDNFHGVPSGCGRVLLHLSFVEGLANIVDQYCFLADVPAPESGMSDNPDHDSFTNLQEFFFGLDPLTPEAPSSAFASGTVTKDLVLGKTYFTVTFRRRMDVRTSYVVAVSDDLAGWDSTQSTVEITGTVPTGDGLTETVTCRVTTTTSPNLRKFVRIEADLPP